MANGYGFFNMGSSKSVTDEDFDEEEVWATVVVQKEKREMSPKLRKNRDVSATRPLPTATRMIPNSNNSTKARIFQQSAPVNIPDWSKIYRTGFENQSFKGSRVGDKGGHGYADDDDGDDHDHRGGDDDDDDDKTPPHELIAKKLARTQINAFSVCEGVGRTLKGRDLSKVRNAVLTRTGFLE